jgi:hypothetical protein
MKKFLLGAISFGTLSLLAAGMVVAPASRLLAAESAGSHDKDYTEGFEALKQDIARLREQNAALRERQQLREENAALAERQRLRDENATLAAHSQPSSAAAPARKTPSATAHGPRPVVAQAPQTETGRIPMVLQSNVDPDSPLAAYAADMPAFKAPVLADKGQTLIWVDGGAFGTGGDRIPYAGGLGTIIGGLLGDPSLAGDARVTPGKVGWEGMTGFDHRFAGTRWHVNGELLYGQTTASDSAGGAILNRRRRDGHRRWLQYGGQAQGMARECGYGSRIRHHLRPRRSAIEIRTAYFGRFGDNQREHSRLDQWYPRGRRLFREWYGIGHQNPLVPGHRAPHRDERVDPALGRMDAGLCRRRRAAVRQHQD